MKYIKITLSLLLFLVIFGCNKKKIVDKNQKLNVTLKIPKPLALIHPTLWIKRSAQGDLGYLNNFFFLPLDLFNLLLYTRKDRLFNSIGPLIILN